MNHAGNYIGKGICEALTELKEKEKVMKDYYKCMCCEREVPAGCVIDKETWIRPKFAFYKHDRWKEERLWCEYCLGITEKHGEEIVKDKQLN